MWCKGNRQAGRKKKVACALTGQECGECESPSIEKHKLNQTSFPTVKETANGPIVGTAAIPKEVHAFFLILI